MSTREHYIAAAVVTVLLLHAVAIAAADFAADTGEPGEPYQITTAGQLIAIGSDPNLFDRHFVLVNDIDLDPNLQGRRVFTSAVIAPDLDPAERFQGTAFSGSFDGNGHAIRNLSIRSQATDRDEEDYLGLFGNLGEGAVVKDLAIEASTVDGEYGQYHGALAAWNEGRIVRCRADGRVSGGIDIGGLVGRNEGHILDCHTRGGIVSGGKNVGGLVGNNGARVIRCLADCEVRLEESQAGGLVGFNDGYICASYATGNVLAAGLQTEELGGLVGDNGHSLILGCYATGDISTCPDAHFRSVGGLAGSIHWSSIVNCYATGGISGNRRSPSGDPVGGLVGSCIDGRIVNSYAAGPVFVEGSTRCIGGLVGMWRGGTISASSWNVDTTRLSTSDGPGSTGLTVAEMQDIRTFLAAGWDFAGEELNGFADTWRMSEGADGPTLALLSEGYGPPLLAGSGTTDDPYRIATPAELGAVWHHDPSACYQLAADIDLAGAIWPIAPIPYFNGSFDGAGHTIAHLTVHGSVDLGLSGYLDAEATVTDLSLDEAEIITGDYAGSLFDSGVGMLAGSSEGAVVSCHATGSVSAGRYSFQIGGLVGVNLGTVAECSTAATVSCGDHGRAIGGLAGSNWATIHASYAGGQVVGETGTMYAGGLVGELDHGTVTSSYAHGSVSGGDRSEGLGGLVGRNNEGVIANCYTVATVSAGTNNSSIGNFAGTWITGDVQRCFFLASANGDAPPDNGIATPLTHEQMTRQANFVDWDFVGTWMICEGQGYPHLQWESIPCEL